MAGTTDVIPAISANTATGPVRYTKGFPHRTARAAPPHALVEAEVQRIHGHGVQEEVRTTNLVTENEGV